MHHFACGERAASVFQVLFVAKIQKVEFVFHVKDSEKKFRKNFMSATFCRQIKSCMNFCCNKNIQFVSCHIFLLLSIAWELTLYQLQLDS